MNPTTGNYGYPTGYVRRSKYIKNSKGDLVRQDFDINGNILNNVSKQELRERTYFHIIN